jgi:hypothetical protein
MKDMEKMSKQSDKKSTTLIKSERFYQENFDGCEKPKYLAGSTFYREVPLSYSQSLEIRGTNEMPNASMDFLELDAKGFLHMWEAKKLHSYELKSGRVIGQMMFYDWLFRTNSDEHYQEIFSSAGIPSEVVQSYEIKSWNVLVCGGYGYEIAAPLNPVIWNYPTIPHEHYFKEDAPCLCVWHLFHKKYSKSLAVEPIWHLTIFYPEKVHPEAFLAFLESEHNIFYDYRVTDGGIDYRMVIDELQDVGERIGNMPDAGYWDLMGRSHLCKAEGCE